MFYGNQRELEYDLVVAPGASVRSITVAFDGARRVRLDDAGNIVIETPVGEMRHRKPVAYQLKNGARLPVAASYVLNKSRQVSLEIGTYDPSQPFLIDPVLSYSTSLDAGVIRKVAVDPYGNAYLVGTLPFDSFGSTSIAFVRKLNRVGGALFYSPFLGGNDQSLQREFAVKALVSQWILLAAPMLQAQQTQKTSPLRRGVSGGGARLSGQDLRFRNQVEFSRRFACLLNVLSRC